MPNRKKRLKKGIESLKKQILMHEEKLKKAINMVNYKSFHFLRLLLDWFSWEN